MSSGPTLLTRCFPLPNQVFRGKADLCRASFRNISLLVPYSLAAASLRSASPKMLTKPSADKWSWRISRPFNIFSMRKLRSALSLTKVLMLAWLYILWRGERMTFDKAVASCRWNAWENWVHMTQSYVSPAHQPNHPKFLLRQTADISMIPRCLACQCDSSSYRLGCRPSTHRCVQLSTPTASFTETDRVCH